MAVLTSGWRRLKQLAASLSLCLLAAPAPAGEATAFHYDETNVDTATYFAAISNLANAVMFSGLGEKLVISPYERDDWLRRAGYVTRPPMPDMGIIGSIYASGLPKFKQTPDFSTPSTLRWDSPSFDRTLNPGAQAWTLLKITSPEFHLQFHALPENRLAALMMVPQARAQARVLEDRLLNPDGLFTARSPDGKFQAPEPRHQAAVLWAVSTLILASTSKREDYWHRAYRDLVTAKDYRALATRAFTAVQKLPPKSAGERALAIEALGRYALVEGQPAARRQALALARRQADALRGDAGTMIEDMALAVYGLTEASRLFGERGYLNAAVDLFRVRLLSSWEDRFGVFRTGTGAIVYTPRRVGAVIAALNAMRWHGPEDAAAQARKLYPRFFENAVVRSGLLQASPLPLVSMPYLEKEPASNFAHPLLVDPAKVGMAPVFAAEVVHEGAGWRVTNHAFRTEEAMFLANMLAVRSQGRADTFLPEDRLNELR